MQFDDLQIVFIGLSVVFVGLLFIVLLCTVFGLFSSSGKKKTPIAVPETADKTEHVIENREELLVCIAAAVSEYTGKNLDGIKILNIKEID